MQAEDMKGPLPEDETWMMSKHDYIRDCIRDMQIRTMRLHILPEHLLVGLSLTKPKVSTEVDAGRMHGGITPPKAIWQCLVKLQRCAL